MSYRTWLDESMLDRENGVILDCISAVEYLFGDTMTLQNPSKAKDKLLFVFTDKFMVLWLALAVGGMFMFHYSRLGGILLCVPAGFFFSVVFIMLFIANRKQKAKRP